MNRATRKKGAILDQIATTIRKEHPKVIEAEGDALIDMAIRAIANQYSNLRPGSSSSAQLEFFAEYAVSERVTIPVTDKDGVTRSASVRVDQLTLDQARRYLQAHQRAPRRSKRLIAMERLVRDVSPYGTGASTIAECWKASKTGKASGTND
jgi:hypothetical protein